MEVFGALKERATEPEWMDQSSFDRDLAEQSFRFIEVVNRLFGGIRMVKRFVAAEAARLPAGKTLRVIDIGSGSCDIPIAVCRWARRRHIPVHFTCIECNHHAMDRARRNLRRAGDLPIRLIQEDIYYHHPLEPYDAAVASMFFHHFTEKDMAVLIARVRGLIRSGLLINDLRRCLPGYLGCRLLLLGFPRAVRHDALLSVRKGFTPSEMKTLLHSLDSTAGVEVSTAPFFRIEALVHFNDADGS